MWRYRKAKPTRPLLGSESQDSVPRPMTRRGESEDRRGDGRESTSYTHWHPHTVACKLSVHFWPRSTHLRREACCTELQHARLPADSTHRYHVISSFFELPDKTNIILLVPGLNTIKSHGDKAARRYFASTAATPAFTIKASALSTVVRGAGHWLEQVKTYIYCLHAARGASHPANNYCQVHVTSTELCRSWCWGSSDELRACEPCTLQVAGTRGEQTPTPTHE